MMKKIFPDMYNRISGGHIFCIISYCIFGLVLLPGAMPYIADGFYDNDLVLSWLELIYHVINSIVLILILRDALKDAFLDLRFSIKSTLLTVLIAVAPMLVWIWVAPDVVMNFSGNGYFSLISLDVFPVSPPSSMMTPGFLVTSNPLFGTLIMTLLVPFSVCGLYYATAFAPACCKKSWLGYLCVTVALLLAVLFDNRWQWNPEVMSQFLMILPVHLLACWTYQKTDNIWSPIMTLGIFNLAASLFNNLVVNVIYN